MKHLYSLLFSGILAYSLIAADHLEPKKEDPDNTLYRWSRTLAEVMHTTKEKHYQPKDLQECMIQACDAFLTSLDPHSSFLSPKAYQSITDTMAGSFFGIGVVIDATKETHNKFLTVIDTIPEGPADKAGIKPLDKIIDIENKPLEGMTIEEATAKLKGPRHSPVHIKILREGQSDLIEFTIKRDEIKEQNSLCFYLDDHNIYYLALSMFTQQAVNQLEHLISQAQTKKPRALIIDLRNNSGGLLTSAIDIVGLFVPKNSLVVTVKDKNNTVLNNYQTQRNPIASSDIPIFIMINNFTASAAEILAGCLKYYAEHRFTKNQLSHKLTVFLVGTPTWGKGSVQEVIPLSNDCAAKITTSLYFLPGDRSIQAIGIEPDFIIEKMMPQTKQANWLVSAYGREKTLKNHITLHKPVESKLEEKNNHNEHKSWIERAQGRLLEDNQFRETINIINIYDAARTHSPHLVIHRPKAISYINQVYIGSKEPIKMSEVKNQKI